MHCDQIPPERRTPFGVERGCGHLGRSIARYKQIPSGLSVRHPEHCSAALECQVKCIRAVAFWRSDIDALMTLSCQANEPDVGITRRCPRHLHAERPQRANPGLRASEDCGRSRTAMRKQLKNARAALGVDQPRTSVSPAHLPTACVNAIVGRGAVIWKKRP